jgi:predicted nucleic acid-binding protein
VTDLLREALRKLKPERKVEHATPRAIGAFSAAASVPTNGRFALILDTNVYIENAGGTLPLAATNLLDRCLQFHSTVCLGEIAIGVAAYHPSALHYARVRDYYERLLEKIPDNRILMPDSDIWIEAGLVAGTLARTQTLQASQRKELLNDALLYLTAAKIGLPVLTENKADFDLIQQIVGRGQFIYY